MNTATHLRAAFAGAMATFGLTALHHSYGAIVYSTPWRHHATVVAAIAGAVLWLARRAYERYAGSTRGSIGLAIFVAVTSLYAVVAIGAFEGFYNHVIKVVTYFAGMPLELHRELFPPPVYELPNDAIFEISGVLQVVPAAYTALALVRLLRADWSKRALAP